MINVTGTINWIYSLFKAWWIAVIALFVVICIVGIGNSFIVGLLCALSLMVWAKVNRSIAKNIKEVINIAVAHVKSWWINRPDFIEK